MIYRPVLQVCVQHFDENPDPQYKKPIPDPHESEEYGRIRKIIEVKSLIRIRNKMKNRSRLSDADLRRSTTLIRYGTGTSRDIQRLPTTFFSLVLRKEYFGCPQRDSHAVHYIYKRKEREVCALVLCSLATVTSCIDPSVMIVTKSPKVGPCPLLVLIYFPSLWVRTGTTQETKEIQKKLSLLLFEEVPAGVPHPLPPLADD
jgi:hypothetical protein